MQLKTFAIASLLTLAQTALAFPKVSPQEFKRMVEEAANKPKPDIRDGQTGRIVKFDPVPSFTGTKKIPDAAHPYKAPGPKDLRGPCPALNTLANHGYIPHNGSATVEQIHRGVMEAFNVEHDFAAFVVSFATLARGNPFIGMLSIGHNAQDIPPPPGKIDGPVAGGIAMHGRFEGDVSSTRRDIHIGDSVNFQYDLFDTLLNYVGRYGDSGPEGNYSIVNHKVFQEFKFDRFNQDQQEDKDLQFHVTRVFTAFSEVAFILEFFANGTTTQLSSNAMGSIFRNQTFAPNWFRRASPAGLPVMANVSTDVRCAHPISPGANDVNGNYVVDSDPMCNGGFDFLCASYTDIVESNVAGVYNNATGVMKTNVDYFLDAIFKPFNDLGNCSRVLPKGVAGV